MEEKINRGGYSRVLHDPFASDVGEVKVYCPKSVSVYGDAAAFSALFGCALAVAAGGMVDKGVDAVYDCFGWDVAASPAAAPEEIAVEIAPVGAKSEVPGDAKGGAPVVPVDAKRGGSWRCCSSSEV